jgi:hypothetical protein
MIETMENPMKTMETSMEKSVSSANDKLQLQNSAKNRFSFQKCGK